MFGSYTHKFNGIYIGNDRCYNFTKNGFAMFTKASDVTISSMILLDGLWEKHNTDFFYKYLLKDGMNCIDVGANMGYYSIMMGLRSKKGNGHMWVFEPNPEMSQLIKDNLHINGLNNYSTFIPAACVSKAEIRRDNPYNAGKVGWKSNLTLPFHVRKTYTGGSSVLPRTDCPDEMEVINVHKTALDDEIPPGTRIDLIRIDAEGYDYNVLQGADRILEENPECKIFFEFFPEMISKTGNDPRHMLEWLSTLGYKFIVIDETYTGKATIDDIMSKFPCNDRIMTDVLAYKD